MNLKKEKEKKTLFRSELIDTLQSLGYSYFQFIFLLPPRVSQWYPLAVLNLFKFLIKFLNNDFSDIFDESRNVYDYASKYVFQCLLFLCECSLYENCLRANEMKIWWPS